MKADGHALDQADVFRSAGQDSKRFEWQTRLT